MSIFGTYYGSKYRIIDKYPKPKANITRIVEPFCGGGAYLLKHSNYELIGIEKDKLVHDAYLILQNLDEKELDNLDYQKGDIIKEHPYYPLMRQLASIPAGDKVTEFGFKRKSSRIRTIKKHLSTIKNIQFIHGDAFDYFDKYDSVDTLWFIDPPYQGKGGKHYKCGNQYIDFPKLADAIKKLKGQVIVCGYIDDDYLPFTPLTNNLGMSKKKISEGVYTNI